MSFTSYDIISIMMKLYGIAGLFSSRALGSQPWEPGLDARLREAPYNSKQKQASL